MPVYCYVITQDQQQSNSLGETAIPSATDNITYNVKWDMIEKERSRLQRKA